MITRTALIKGLALRILLLLCALLVIYLVVITSLVIWNFRIKLSEWPQYTFCCATDIRVGRNINEISLMKRLKRLGYEKSNALAPLPGQYTVNNNELQVHFRPSLTRGRGIVEGPVLMELEKNIIKKIRLMRSNRQAPHFLMEPELLSISGDREDSGSFMSPEALSHMEPNLISAVVLTEDMRFRDHHGIDPTSILRAIKANWRAGKYVQGGSTIPQQLIKMTALSPEKKMTRKIVEASMAMVADLLYSKDDILMQYLNRVYLGHVGSRPVKGVCEASRLYYAKKCSELSPEESAMIAGMIRAPNVINPNRRPARARKRRNMILGLLRDAGKISEQEYIRAANSAVSMRNPTFEAVDGSAFLALIKGEISQFLQGKTDNTGNRVFMTTLDPIQQILANKVYNSLTGGDQKGLVMVVDAFSGAIKAFAGSNAWPGKTGDFETLAPFIAIAALSPTETKPPGLSLTTLIYPENGADDPVTFREAFHKDPVKVVEKIVSDLGPKKIIESLKAFDIHCKLNKQGELVLPALSPMELAEKYSLLSGLGTGAGLFGFIPPDSQAPFRSKKRSVAVDPAVIYLVNRLLKPYPKSTAGLGRISSQWKLPSMIISRAESGIWGIGYWHNHLALVKFSDTTIEEQRVKTALESLTPEPKFYIHKAHPPPEGLIFRKVCLESGLRATSLCGHVINAPFLKGTQPSEWCPLTSHEQAR